MIKTLKTQNLILNIDLNSIKSGLKQIFHGLLPLYLMFHLTANFLNFTIIYGYLFTTWAIYTNKAQKENLNITITLLFLILFCILLPGYIDVSLPN